MEMIEKFNIINQTEMDKKLLVCAKCGNWLTAAIFLKPDGLNYCQLCSDTYGIRQNMLEEAFVKSKFKYPCGNMECDYIEKAENIEKHMKVCPYGPIKCLYCELEDLNEFKIKTHLLEKHPDIVQQISIEEPVVTLNLDVQTTDKLYILDLKCHTLIVMVKFIDDGSFSLMVAKQTVLDSTPNVDFMVQYETEKVQKRGTIYNIKQVFAHSDFVFGTQFLVKDKLNKNKEIVLTVYFFGFESIEKSVMEDCPICFKRFVTEIYQCPNGHNVCHECIKNINTCSICRENMNMVKFHLKHLLPNFQFPCPYSDAGCLEFLKGNEVESHVTLCLYRTVNCDDCKEAHPSNNIIKHMQGKHNYGDNLQAFCKQFTSKLPNIENIYIKFKDLLFRFIVFTSINRKNETAGYNVQLLYHDNVEEALKYRYEVHILDNNINCIAKHIIGNHCQISSDASITAKMNWKFFKQFTHNSCDGELNFKFRYCVYEINQ